MADETPERKTGLMAGLMETLATVAIALALAMVPRIVLGQPYTIPSESMQPTLQVGDYVIVSKFPYGWSRNSVPFSPPLGQGRVFGRPPRRGDIVVFMKPNDNREEIIKRLVGLPGDRLQVVGGVLTINGAPVQRQALADGVEDTPYGAPVQVARFKETLPNGKSFVTDTYGPQGAQENTGVYVVPAGCYFMMGDNRDNSLDSRFAPGAPRAGESRCAWNHELDRFIPPETGMGFVPFDDLIGRADLVLFSLKPGATLLKPWTLITNMRWDRTFHGLGAAAAS